MWRAPLFQKSQWQAPPLSSSCRNSHNEFKRSLYQQAVNVSPSPGGEGRGAGMHPTDIHFSASSRRRLP